MTKTYMTKIFTVLMLMMFSLGASADVKVEIGEFKGGTIKEKEQSKPDANGLVTVTIIVTPDKGYTIKSTDITVVSTYPLSDSRADTRDPKIAAPLILLGKDPENLGDPREYSFIVASSLGAWVKEANFSNSSKGPNRSLTKITSLSDITDADGSYYYDADIDASDFSTISSFSGTLTAQAKDDGTFPVISHLRCPLFGTATDATISNIMIKDVAFRQDGPVGAIACTANGTTRIYNCGILPSSNTYSINNSAASRNSSIASNDSYCGGLVGLLDGSSRVINCFSYANISGGTVKAGIVGYNNYASKYNDLKTMVMNCMFYGNITTGGSVYPIYGGNEISNDYKANTNNNRLNNYNYFLYEAPFSNDNTTTNPIITAYNCALAAEERFLVRFEFYRHLLNSTRELATWYATGSAANAFSTMAKWVLDKEIAPYPILKAYSSTNYPEGRYPSVVNYDPVYTINATGKKIKRADVTEPNQGGVVKTLGNSGSLTINIEAGSGAKFGAPTGASINTSSITRPIIDKDFAQYNFNYGKVQLPYYNEVGTGNYTTASDGTSRVVTGWMIVSMDGGTAGGYTETNYDAPHYNYADRDHIGKDLYGTSGRIFAQGAYFNVPKGVTSITIKPYWAKCAYLSDANYDRYGYNNTDNLSQIGGGRYTNDNSYTINGVSQKVYTTFTNARDAMGSTYVSGATVYDYAVVLVGNYHHHTNDAAGEGDELSSVTAKPFTVTSIDLNKDNEPDYCLIFRSGKQKQVCPIRYDFITLPGMAMAHKMATHTNLAIPGNCKPNGWFEVTTTGLIKFGQFEHSWETKTEAPLILMGGVIDQFVSNNTAGTNGNKPNNNNKTQYMIFGDNVYFELLSNGTHADNKSPTPHRPMSLVGGEYKTLYLSGYFRPDADACTATSGDNNAECYIDGGKFDEVAGAGQENISGDVTWLIDHADIESFYGGGIKVVAGGSQITGDISTTIKNSRVTLFCGGPKFGNVANTKKVVTDASGCTFGKFFGAGYGGTSIYRDRIKNEFQYLNYNDGSNRDWAKWINDTYDKSSAASYRGKYTEGKGVSVGYEYEFFGGSKGNVARLYLKYASFSLAQTKNVSSKLTDCTVLEDFYGGGSFGAVDGNVTSTLDNCTVKGNVFGAGYSVQTPTVDVIGLGGFTPTPNYNETTAVFEKGNPPSSEVYTWANSSVSNGGNALVDDNHTIKTNEAITGLGAVNGNVTLILKGNTVVGTVGDNNTGNVYGGGDASSVKVKEGVADSGNITIYLAGNTEVLGNVYGGGNSGLAEGSTEVNILDNAPTLNN